MQNTINQLPIELIVPAAQPKATEPKLSAESNGAADFSEAMGSATDKVSQTEKTDNTNDQPGKVQESGTADGADKTTKDESKPVEETTEEEPKAELPGEMDTSGFVNIHQTIAGMVIQITNEREAMEIIGLDSVPGMDETEGQTVDVLEGLQMQDSEDGIVTAAEAQPEQPGREAQAVQASPEVTETAETDDIQAWMPKQSSETEAPVKAEAPIQQATEPAQTPAPAPVQAADVEREIESRLEEHLRPLENLNGSEEPITTEEIQTGFEIEVKQTKEEKSNIEDIELSEPEADMPEMTDKPLTATERPNDEADTEAGDDGRADTEQRKQPIEEKPKTELPKQSDIGAVRQEVQQPVRPVAERVEESVFSKMVENISTNAQQGNKEFSINLRPDFMGDMSIQLVMTAEGLSARIKTDDPQASSMISQHLFKLEQSLKEQGIDIVNLEVSVFDTGDMTKEDFSKQGGQNQPNAKAGRMGRVSATSAQAAAVAGLETLTESQTLEPTGLNSSVEYIA